MSKPGYPLWWDTTVTVYNKITDASTQVVTWYKTVITDCFWKMTGAEVRVGDAVLDSKAIVCRIPKSPIFMEKQDWIKLPVAQLSDYFTLAQGDIIVKGECAFDINEYEKGYRSSDLLGFYSQYQACMEITEFSNNTGIGRNNEHYLARGK